MLLKEEDVFLLNRVLFENQSVTFFAGTMQNSPILCGVFKLFSAENISNNQLLFADLNHHNVSKFVGVLKKNGETFFIFEGGDLFLEDFLQTCVNDSRTLNDTQIVSIAYQFLNGFLFLERRSPNICRPITAKLEEFGTLVTTKSLQEIWEAIVCLSKEGSCLREYIWTKTEKKQFLNFILRKFTSFSFLESMAGTTNDSGFQYTVGLNYHTGKSVVKDLRKAVEWYTLASNQGHAGAQSKLARCYFNGEGVERDMRKVVHYLTLCANQGDPTSQFMLAGSYANGEGVEKDLHKAVEWYTLAANQGHAGAQTNLALCYFNGEGVETDQGKAKQLLTKSVDQGNSDAQYNLAVWYANGDGVEKDMSKAVQLYIKAANQGHCGAQNNLGACYVDGEGVEKNMQKAVELYTLAAKQGYSCAQYNLAQCYYNGRAVEKDFSKAVQWYTLAANQGHSDAQYNLAVCYKKGEGVRKDIRKAVEWYTLAAKQGHSDAQYLLAYYYFQGTALEKDWEKAIYWYTLAAEQGHGVALNNLAICYQNGQGVAKDLRKAVNLFSLAAKQGIAGAQNNLALCYQNGQGVEKNLSEALKLFTMVVNQGLPTEKYYNLEESKYLSQNNLKLLFETTTEPIKLFKEAYLLGCGSEGLVFRVEISGKFYALKMLLNLYLEQNEQLQNKYLTEWNILQTLEGCDNVIKPISHFVTLPTKEMMNAIADPDVRSCLYTWNPVTRCLEPAETHFFLLEYHPIDLQMKLSVLRSSGQLTWKTILKYCLELLQGIEALFNHQVFHNDMKLDNILISSSDSLIFADFGLSVRTSNQCVPSESLKDGNRQHKAPEIHNKIAQNELQIDVEKQYSWEAGILIYEIAFGKTPFEKEGSFYPFACEHQILSEIQASSGVKKLPLEEFQIEEVNEKERAFFPLTSECEHKILSEIQVPPLEFPEEMIEGEGVEEWKGVLTLLLENNPNDRIHISNATLILQEIFSMVQ